MKGHKFLIFLIFMFFFSFGYVALAGETFNWEKANYVGHELRVIKNCTDPEDCGRACRADPNCRVASFHGPRAGAGWANCCVLRSAVGNSRPANLISGRGSRGSNSRSCFRSGKKRLKKEGSEFDLPIAVGILSATGVVNPSMAEKATMAGELALDGSVSLGSANNFGVRIGLLRP